MSRGMIFVMQSICKNTSTSYTTESNLQGMRNLRNNERQVSIKPYSPEGDSRVQGLLLKWLPSIHLGKRTWNWHSEGNYIIGVWKWKVLVYTNPEGFMLKSFLRVVVPTPRRQNSSSIRKSWCSLHHIGAQMTKNQSQVQKHPSAHLPWSEIVGQLRPISEESLSNSLQLLWSIYYKFGVQWEA